MDHISNIHSDATAGQQPFLLGLKSLFTLWIRNHETRKSLNGLEHHRLLDIGVNRPEAEVEGRKPFWR